MKRRITIVFVALLLAFGPAALGRVLAGQTGDPENDPSLPGDPAYAVNEDQNLNLAAPGVLANDGPPSPVLCIEPGSENVSVLDGSLDLRKNGSFEFAPNENYNGSTTFTYRMGTSQTSIDNCPEGGQSNTALVTITVNAVNDPPFVSTGVDCAVDVEVAEDSGAFDDAPQCVQMQDFGPMFGPGNENDQHFEAWLVSTNKPELFASGPTITLVGDDIHAPVGRLTFTPAANAIGQANVTVRGRDDGGTANGGDNTSDPTSFKIRITQVNDAPTANADSFTALPDRTLNVKDPGVLKNDSDIDGDDLTASKVSNPAHGIVNLASDGGFSYTPTAGYIGPDAFSYRASDGSEFSPPRVVSLNVTAVPTPIPTAVPPTAAPTAAPTAESSLSPSPSASLEASPSVDPNASPSASPSASASLEPGASPAPEPAGSGGLSIPVLVVLLVLIALLAFSAAIYVPKWLERQRAGGSSDDL